MPNGMGLPRGQRIEWEQGARWASYRGYCRGTCRGTCHGSCRGPCRGNLERVLSRVLVWVWLWVSPRVLPLDLPQKILPCVLSWVLPRVLPWSLPFTLLQSLPWDVHSKYPHSIRRNHRGTSHGRRQPAGLVATYREGYAKKSNNVHQCNAAYFFLIVTFTFQPNS